MTPTDCDREISKKPMRIIACEVFRAEIEALAKGLDHLRGFQWLEMSQHDRPDELRKNLQKAIEEAERDPAIEAVGLAYGLCGQAASGLGSQRCRLVIPRAHDCIGILLGGHAACEEVKKKHPGAYWYSPGWIQGEKVPGPDFFEKKQAEYLEKYGEEDAVELMDALRFQYRLHQEAVYMDSVDGLSEMGLAFTRQAAASMGWGCSRVPASLRILEDLFSGKWDEDRFLVLKPGEKIVFSGDQRVMKAGERTVEVNDQTDRQAGEI